MGSVGNREAHGQGQASDGRKVDAKHRKGGVENGKGASSVPAQGPDHSLGFYEAVNQGLSWSRPFFLLLHCY